MMHLLLALLILFAKSAFASLVYVSDYYHDRIFAIDTNGNTVQTISLSTSFGGAYGLAITSAGFLYAANYYSYSSSPYLGLVTVLNTSQGNAVAATVSISSVTNEEDLIAPTQMAVTPNGNYVYVANGLEGSHGTVSVIDTSSYEVAATVADIGRSAYQIAFTSDGNYAYITNRDSEYGAITIIDTNPSSGSYNTVVNSLPASASTPYSYDLNSVHGIAIYGTRAYVCSSANDRVYMIDTSDPTNASPEFVEVSVGTFSLADPYGIAIAPSGNYAYVTNNESNTVLVIDTNPDSANYNKVIVSIELLTGSNPNPVAITPDGNYAYVGNQSGDTVSLIDTNPSSGAFNTLVDTIALPGTGVYPTSIVIGGSLSLNRAFQRPSNRR